MDMKKLFGFGSSTPPPPAVPTKPPTPPFSKSGPAAKPPAPVVVPSAASLVAATPPANPAGPSIVGRWKEPSGGDTTEFHADGSVTEMSGGETIRGRYSFVDGTLKINLDGLDEELSFSATVSNEALEMTGGDGQLTKYQRA